MVALRIGSAEADALPMTLGLAVLDALDAGNT